VESVLAQRFYDMLTAEVDDNIGGLPAELYQELRRYYRALASNPRRRPFYRHNWIRRTAPMVQLLTALPKQDVPWRVLDAGAVALVRSPYFGAFCVLTWKWSEPILVAVAWL